MNRKGLPLYIVPVCVGLMSSCGHPNKQPTQQIESKPPVFVRPVQPIVEACDSASSSGATLLKTERPFSVMPITAMGIQVDDAGMNLAYATIADPSTKTEGMRMQVNGRLQQAFENIEHGAGTFDRSGKHFVYGAVLRGKWVIVRDGQVGKGRYDGILNQSVSFDPTGKHLAFTARLGGKSLNVIDDNEQTTYEDVSPVAFSQDGSHSAYVAYAHGNAFLVIDGDQNILRYGAQPTVPVWVRDNEFAYVENRGGTLRLVIPGVSEQPELSEVTNDRLAVSSLRVTQNGQHYAYFGRLIDGRLAALVDGEIYGPFQKIGNAPQFSPDGNHYAYAAQTESGKWIVIRDGKFNPNLEFSGIGPLLFSPDSSRLLYAAATDNGKWIVVDNGCPSREYDDLKAVAFLQNGTPVYLFSSSSGITLVIGDREIPVKGRLVYSNVEKTSYVETIRVLALPSETDLRIFQYTYRLAGK
jgi:hypothetical protein